jgi:hypothetical protein
MKSLRNFVILMLIMALTAGFTKGLKRYHVKSGIVEYKIEGSGNILGFKTSEQGTSKLVFKDWGNLEIKKEETTRSREGRVRSLTKFAGGTVYVVDFEERIIHKYSPEMLKDMKDKDLSKTGKEMLEAMGGKKVGNGKILGYPCEIWQAMGSKIWIYKGIPLKIYSNIMGLKRTETAVRAEFDVKVADAVFKLPDYPVKKLEDEMREGLSEPVPETGVAKKPASVSRPPQSAAEKNPAAALPVPEEMQKMIKGFGKLFGGK